MNNKNYLIACIYVTVQICWLGPYIDAATQRSPRVHFGHFHAVSAHALAALPG